MKKFWWAVLPISLVAFIFIFIGYGKSTLPQLEGTVAIEGLKDKVEIIRDDFGIPHIYAQSDEDAFRALGYVMASDRLFQMDLLRRIASGRLSEVIGPKLLFADKLMRTLRIRATADKFLAKNQAKLNPDLVRLASVFYEGVNHYKDTNSLPIEFSLLGYKPEKFDFNDGLSISGYMALTFAEGLVGDMLFTRLLKKMPAEQVAELRVGTTKDRYSSNSSTKIKNNQVYHAPSDEAFKDVVAGIESLKNTVGMFPGSNSWVLNADRSKSGQPILANDPHISYSQPAVFYEAYLHTPKTEIYGHFLPLIPFPILGHNREKGWAITMSEVDDLDLYAEKINPENPKQVMHNGEWVDMEVIEEEIKIKGQDSEKLTVRVTPNGPIIDNTKYGTPGSNISIKWLYHHPENDVISSFYGFLRARNLEDYKKALTHAAAPGLNISWVDKDGNIAWWMLGKVPVRPEGMRSDIVNEGWSGKNNYKGYLPTSKNPHLVNPENGVIVSANYKPLDPEYQNIPGYWQPSDRYERIADLLKEKTEWDVESLKKVQTDINFAWGPKLVKAISAALKQDQKLLTPREKNLIDKLENWDGEAKIDSSETALFYSLIYHIGKEALEDELGADDFKAFYRIASYWHFFKTFAFTETSPWWDNVGTKDKRESRAEILSVALKKSIEFLEERYGNSFENWKWGDMHALILEHPIGKKKPFDKVFNVGPIEAGGGSFQVNNMADKTGDGNFHPKVGPATRRLVDMAQPDKSLGIIPSGNSGNVFSPHYADQVNLYLQGKYRPQIMNRDELKGKKVLTLTPKKS